MTHKDPEAKRAYARAYYAANGDRLRAKSRVRAAAYGAANRDKIRAYKIANRDKIRAQQAAWYAANRDLLRSKGLRRRYNIDTAQYDQLLEAQGGACAICREPPNGESLRVDHDHACCPGPSSCGRCVRGLLHDHCNRHLVAVELGPDWVRSALAYLADPPARLHLFKR